MARALGVVIGCATWEVEGQGTDGGKEGFLFSCFFSSLVSSSKGHWYVGLRPHLGPPAQLSGMSLKLFPWSQVYTKTLSQYFPSFLVYCFLALNFKCICFTINVIHNEHCETNKWPGPWVDQQSLVRLFSHSVLPRVNERKTLHRASG